MEEVETLEEKMLNKKIFLLFSFVIIGSLISSGFAQDKTIVFVSRPDKIDPIIEQNPDQPFIDELLELGYNVLTFYNESLSTAEEASLDTLLNADLIIIGRSVGSDHFDTPDKEFWNALPTPTLLLHHWAARSNRLNWLNSSTCTHYDTEGDDLSVIAEEPTDPVFTGVDVTSDIPWCYAPYDVITVTDPGNGINLATSLTDGSLQFVRFEPDVEFYPGSVDMPLGPRTCIGNGNDHVTLTDGNLWYNYYNFTEQSRLVYLNEIKLMLGETVAVENSDIRMAQDYELLQNYPNPFNPVTTIQFKLEKSSHATLQVYNVVGQLVETLVDGHFSAGIHKVTFDARNLESGVYFYKVTSADFSKVRKMTLIK